MAMTYTTLTGGKTQAGSIIGWVNYTKLSTDVVTILDEAQALLYGLLRVREMRTRYRFSLAVGDAYVAVPARFLDPIGRIRLTSFNTQARHKDESFVKDARTYSETSGSLGTSPFTTVSGSNSVTVTLPSHGFVVESSFYTTGASAFNGATIAGTFSITSITDANNFVIDISGLGTTPSGSGAGGGAAVTYVCDLLASGVPVWFGIWDERVQFDVACFQQTLAELMYFQSLPLLSPSNLTNFLTNRYPHLLRRACVTMAADYMKDSGEYQKNLSQLTALVEAVNVENDMAMRGMELDTETP